MLERFRSLFSEKTNHKADSIHTAIFKIYCGLPESPKNFKDGPSWTPIEEEDLLAMSEIDRGFLLAIQNGSPHFRLLAHTREHESWIGFSTLKRRVRYCLKEESLFVHYESFEGDSWEELYKTPLEKIEDINPFIALAQKYVALGSGPSSS